MFQRVTIRSGKKNKCEGTKIWKAIVLIAVCSILAAYSNAYLHIEDMKTTVRKPAQCGLTLNYSYAFGQWTFFFNGMSYAYFNGISTGEYWFWRFLETGPLCWDSSSGRTQRGLLWRPVWFRERKTGFGLGQKRLMSGIIMYMIKIQPYTKA